jgi:hypothetical protein
MSAGHTRQVRLRTVMAPAGVGRRPIAAMAVVGRIQDRCRGKSLVMAPDDASRPSWSAGSIVQSRSVTVPAGVATASPVVSLAVALTTSWRWRWRGGSHGRRHRSPCSEPRRPPYGARGRDSLCQSRATRSDLSRSQFVPSRTGRIFPAQETAPSFSTDGYLAENL